MKIPRRNDFVVCTITKINPYSAFAKLEEYSGMTGMIHISEIKGMRIKNIRTHLKEGMLVVCKIIKLDDKNNVWLSIKRIPEKEKDRMLRKFKVAKKNELLLQMIGEKKNKSLNEVWNELGNDLVDEFGSLEKVFKYVQDEKTEKIPKEWLSQIQEVLKEKFPKQKKELKENLNIVSYSSNGINTIKDILIETQKEKDIKVSYISAPIYQISLVTDNPKVGEKRINEIVQKISNKIKSHDIEISSQKICK